MGFSLYSVFATPYFATRLKIPAPGSVFAVLAEQNQNPESRQCRPLLRRSLTVSLNHRTGKTDLALRRA
jgi:hypothetical protein